MAESKLSNMNVIFCEMCPDEDRKPARKTCMKCEISMCVQHLQAHLTTPVLLQTHPLTEPMAAGAATKCPDHSKLLEYYCLDDLTCVCVSCAIEDQHRLHNMKTFSTAHKELLEKLSAEQKELLFKTDDDSVSLEKWETNEREKVTNSSVRLIEAITNLRDLTLASVKTSVSARTVALQTSKNSIQAAQNEKDTYRFLQLYSQVHKDVEKAKAVDLRKGLEPGPDQDKLIEEINAATITEQAEDFCGSLLRLVDPEHHQKISYTHEDLFFEPETLSSGMSLSTDKREIFFTGRMGVYSATLLVQSKSAHVDNYIISLPQNKDWIIGLCNRKYYTNKLFGPGNSPENELVFGLSCDGSQLSILISQEPQPKKKQKMLPTSSTFLSGADTIAVEVVWASPVLSFYSRSGTFNKTLIYSLNISPNDQDLKHFVKLGKDNMQFTPQNQWMCSCGTNHYINIYDSTSNKCGRCGAIVGGISTTELVCQLV